MLQMPSYAQMAGLSWREAAPRCALAALGDVGITILIYVAGALVASSFTYAIRARWNVYLGLAIMGIMHSFWIERAALASGQWTYTDSMPLIPFASVGL